MSNAKTIKHINPPVMEIEPSAITLKEPEEFIIMNKHSNGLIIPEVGEQENKADKKVNCTINIVFAYTHITIRKEIQLNIDNILMTDIINECTPNGPLKEYKEFAISYYDNRHKLYRYYGKYPFKKDYHHLPLERSDEISIKIRQILNMSNALRMEFCEDEQEIVDEEKVKNNIKLTSKRAKERKISYIINKVYSWRKMYNNGIVEESKDGTKKLKKYNLGDAAELLKISKKSLDDYLIQLRDGKKYGFDFNAHKNDKVGILRAFVKMHKTKSGNKQLDDKMSNKLSNMK